jgi:hypothetical protein
MTAAAGLQPEQGARPVRRRSRRLSHVEKYVHNERLTMSERFSNTSTMSLLNRLVSVNECRYNYQ